MTQIFCFVDDFLKVLPKLAHWRNSPNWRPCFTDSEVITIGLMQSCLGVATLKKAFHLMSFNYPEAFLRLWAAVDLGLTTDGGILLGDFAYGGPETVSLVGDEADLLMMTRSTHGVGEDCGAR